MAQKHAPRGPIKTRDPKEAQNPIRPRCTAHGKTTKKPCAQPAILGGTVCRYHGGAAPQVMASAMERLRKLQHPAVSALDWLINQREFPSAAVSAAREIFDRTDGKPAERVAVEHSGGLVIRHEGLD